MQHHGRILSEPQNQSDGHNNHRKKRLTASEIHTKDTCVDSMMSLQFLVS